MPLTAANFITKGPVLHQDLLQFFNLFTGAMTDQPVVFKNTLFVGGNQGNTTVPLRLYGATGQTGHLIDLYVDPSQAQPGFGFSALGNFGWGPGGAAPIDTTLSRVATQNGHATDTAGLLITPYLEVNGPIQATSYQFSNGATITGPAANPFLIAVNQDLTVNRDLTVSRNVAVTSGHIGINTAPPTAPNGAVIGIGPGPGGTPQAIAVTGTFVGTSTSGAVGGIVGQATVQAGFNNGGATGVLWANPVYTSGGFTGLTAETALLSMQPLPSGYVFGNVLHLGAPSGASGLNRSMLADGHVDASGVRATGYSIAGAANANAGAGCEMVYTSGISYVQSYDRTTSTYKPLILSGLGVTLQTNGGALGLPNGSITTAFLATGAVTQTQVVTGAPSGTCPASWAPAPEPFGTTGLVATVAATDAVLITMMCQVLSASASTAAPQGTFIGLGIDGALSTNLGAIVTVVPNLSFTFTTAWMVGLGGLAAGSHRFTIWWQLSRGTDVVWNTAVYSQLSVTVIHR